MNKALNFNSNLVVYFYFIVLLGGLICNGCSTKCVILLLLS